ncbi:hypothetical protein SAMN05216345_12617 [Cupriavidus sp. YR651]|nr:hypothetical protein SAMN05216345_12617 [Cupriavidus sp. YR651]
MAQPIVEPCSRNTMDAKRCPQELGQEAPRRCRRMVIVACVHASSMACVHRRGGTDCHLAEIAGRFPSGPRLCPMDSQRLCVGAGLTDIDRWRSLGCVWQGEHAYAGLHPVWSGVGGLCAGAFAALADRCDPSAQRAKPGDRLVSGGIGTDYCRRSRPRWMGYCCSKGTGDRACNTASRIAQLAGVALAVGVASFTSSYEVGLAVATALTPTSARADGSQAT